jgi:exportin-T
MQDLAEDILDPQSQKAAFVFLRHCVTIWGQPLDSTSPTSNGTAEPQSQGLPGFAHFIYEQLIPAVFKVPSLPQFNIKDGQALVVGIYPAMDDF